MILLLLLLLLSLFLCLVSGVRCQSCHKINGASTTPWEDKICSASCTPGTMGSVEMMTNQPIRDTDSFKADIVCFINGLVILVHNSTIYFPMLIPCHWLISYCTMVLLSLRWCISLTFRVIRHRTITVLPIEPGCHLQRSFQILNLA